MSRSDWWSVRGLELLLAALVFAVTVVTFTGVPEPYPTWPTVGGIPVNPELVVPGALGLVAVVRAGTDPGVGSALVGAVGAVTLLLATTSGYTLYAGSGGGVFWGGFFTLLAGVALALAVVVRATLAATDLAALRSPVRDRSDDA